MVDATRRLPVMAAIPGPTALAFACLGTAVAPWPRGLRARALSLAATGASVLMNAIRHSGGGPGHLGQFARCLHRASDTMIGVLRAQVTARYPSPARDVRDTRPRWPSSAARPRGCCVWPWPRSPHLAGSRAWVLAEFPAAPVGATPTPAAIAAAGWGPAPDQDGPLPGSSHRTAWASRHLFSLHQHLHRSAESAPPSRCGTGSLVCVYWDLRPCRYRTGCGALSPHPAGTTNAKHE